MPSLRKFKNCPQTLKILCKIFFYLFQNQRRGKSFIAKGNREK